MTAGLHARLRVVGAVGGWGAVRMPNGGYASTSKVAWITMDSPVTDSFL
jgi:hypothetical protein